MADQKTSVPSLVEFLPEVYRSDISDTIFSNTVDHFLTKDDTTRVVGSIGDNVDASELITEPDSFRQRHQLQAAAVTDTDNTQMVLSQPSMLEQLKLMGIDSASMNEWGASKGANWAPPINVHKLTNYTEYFWIGTATPQYIVVENRKAVLASKISYLQQQETPNTVLIQTLQTQYDTMADDASNGWGTVNSWVHKTNLPENVYAVRAQVPIIEYMYGIHYHAWNQTIYNWSYAASGTFDSTTVQPTRLELQTISEYTLTSTADSWVLVLSGSNAGYDLTACFTAGSSFQVFDGTNGAKTYTVKQSTYSMINGVWTTSVTINEPIFYNISSAVKASGASITPTRTSVGDPWTGYNNHWRLSSTSTTPCVTPDANGVLDSYNYVGLTALSSNGTSVVLPAKFVADTQVHANNSYLKFNLYDWTDSSLITTGTLFSYDEDDAAPINSALGKKVLATEDGKDFQFSTDLYANNELRAYRVSNNTPVGSFWFSPLRKKAYVWRSSEWRGVVYGTRVATIYTSKPSSPVSEDIYVDSTGVYQFASGSWTLIATPVVSDTDPTLKLVWRYDQTFNYTPTKFDDTTYELMDTWKHNVKHAVPEDVRLTVLQTHFGGILSAQTSTYPSYALRCSEFNFSFPGTIRDYSVGLDLLISAVNVTNHTPTTVIEFAEQQYSSCISLQKDYVTRLFQDSTSSLYSKTSSVLVNMRSKLVTDILATHAANSTYTNLFADATTSTKLTNWPATAAMFGFAPRVAPSVVESDDVVYIKHHDGHRSSLSYSVAEKLKLGKQVIATKINGVACGAILKSLPSTRAEFEATALGSIRTATFCLIGNTLYKFIPVWVDNGAPTFAVEAGNKYFNTTSNAVFVFDGTSWVADNSSNAFAKLWERFDLSTVLRDVVAEVEQRYYDLCSDVPSRAAAICDAVDMMSDQAKTRFVNYCANHSIELPYTSTYNISDPFTWNYYDVTVTEPPFITTANYTAGCWQQLYTLWFGTPYPHIEPWVLQGFEQEPSWWSSEYKDTTGIRRWTPAMWQNILQGVIPSEYVTATTLSPKMYNYVCVNISDSAVGGFKPDELFPPYLSADVIPSETCRSIFQYQAGELAHIAASYSFGQYGPSEWLWRTSFEYAYDKAIIAFQQKPIIALDSIIGYDAVQINGFPLSVAMNNRHSITNMSIHSTTNPYNGIWQWYKQANIYTSFDTSVQFDDLWYSWNMQLCYFTAGIIDENALEITHSYASIVDSDYSVLLANTGVIKDYWIDSFKVSLVAIPPAYVSYNAQAQWEFSVTIPAASSRNVTAYRTQQYPVVIDSTNNELILNAGKYESLSEAKRTFMITGDVEPFLTSGESISVNDLSGTAHTFTTISASFSSSTGLTTIYVTEVIPSETFASTGIVYFERVPVFNSGDVVCLQGTETIPSPATTTNSIFYSSATSNRRIQIADTSTNAAAAAYLELTRINAGCALIGKIKSTFTALGGTQVADTWYHFEIDYENQITINSPAALRGMQNLMNLTDGYVVYAEEQGAIFSKGTHTTVDSDTGRTINWQFEMESFIVWSDNLRNSKLVVSDQYEIKVSDFSNSTFAFVDAIPLWDNGQKIKLLSAGSYPLPVKAGVTYYYVAVSVGVFRISTSSVVTDESAYVTLTTTGAGRLFAFNSTVTSSSYPSMEVNPMRTSVWVDTTTGVLSDVMQGPYADIKIRQTVFDQNGDPVALDNIVVYRGSDDAMLTTRSIDDLHIAGVHVMIEGYEHVITFSNNTKDAVIMYDPILGIQIEKLHIDYYEKTNYDMKPEVGGYFKLGTKFKRNIEASAVDLRNAYDIFANRRSIEVFNRAAALIGFAEQDFLTTLNVGRTSQLMFYRGMLQAKGSDNAIQAYINSKSFEAAYVDELWAWKIADFGDSRRQNTFTIAIKSSDLAVDDVRYSLVPVTTQESLQGFTYIDATDGSRFRYVSKEAATNVLLPSKVSYKFKISDLTSVVFGTKRRILVPKAADMVVVATPNGNVVASQINTRVFEIDSNIATTSALFTIIPAYDAVSPIKLYNTANRDVEEEAPAWDPARGVFNAKVYQYINDQGTTDIARYNSTLITSEISDNPWGEQQVGRIWLDTTLVQYCRYYDTTLFDTIGEQLAAWGQFAAWGKASVYQWVQTTLSPADYIKAAQQDSTTYSGTPKSVTYRRTRPSYNLTTTAGSSYVTGLSNVEVNDTVIFTDTAPAADYTLVVGTAYSVIISSSGYQIMNPDTGTAVVFSATGTFTCKRSFHDDWSVETPLQYSIFAAMKLASNGTITLTPADHGFTSADTVLIYKNSVDLLDTIAGNETTTVDVSVKDLITMIRLVTDLSDTEKSFDPDTSDDGTVDYQRKVDYPYVSKQSVSGTNYFYWIESYVDSSKTITAADIAQDIVSSPDVYCLVLQPLAVGSVAEYGTSRYGWNNSYPQLGLQTYTGGVGYTKLLLRGVRDYVKNASDLELVVTDDESFKDQLFTGDGIATSILKPKHTEWKMIREDQEEAVDDFLWNRMVEAAAGVKISDLTSAVPSASLVLIDQLQGTTNRYGIKEGQAFAKAEDLLATFKSYVNSTAVESDGVDYASFRTSVDLSTPAKIVDTFTRFRNLFSIPTVNSLWFETLSDAMTTRSEYEGIMKTSFIVIRGVKLTT